MLNIFQQGDNIEVHYNKEAQRVTIKNLTKNSTSSSLIKIDKTLPLYVGVALFYIFDEV